MLYHGFKTHHFLEFLLGLRDPLPVIAVHNKDQPLASMIDFNWQPEVPPPQTFWAGIEQHM